MRQALISIVCLLAVGAAHAQSEALPPPPLPGEESVQPGAATPGEQDEVADDFGIRADPYAGTFVGKEVGGGALGVLAADVLSVGIGIGAFLAIYSADPNAALGAAVVGLLGGALLDLVLAPLGAALGVYWTAPKDSSHNGLFGAVLGAYAAQLGIGILQLAISGASAAAFGYTSSDAAGAISLASSLLFLALHYVAMPMVASYGLHWGGRVNRGHARRPEVFPTTPAELYAKENPSGASTLFALAF